MDLETIYAYTRAQAIDDGVLVDITSLSKKFGCKYPVAVTTAVYERYLVGAIPGLDEGSLSDVKVAALMASMLRATREQPPTDTLTFGFIAAIHDGGNWLTSERVVSNPMFPRSHFRLAAVVAHCGPGDDGKPVITIMLPGED